MTVNKWNMRQSYKIETDEILCTTNIDTLPDITGVQCCKLNGKILPKKYFEFLDMVISPDPTSYIQVCSQLCIDGVAQNNFEKCSTDNGQSDYTKCLNKLKPVGCKGIALPVAKSGSVYYYANSLGKGYCTQTDICE